MSNWNERQSLLFMRKKQRKRTKKTLFLNTSSAWDSWYSAAFKQLQKWYLFLACPFILHLTQPYEIRKISFGLSQFLFQEILYTKVKHDLTRFLACHSCGVCPHWQEDRRTVQAITCLPPTHSSTPHKGVQFPRGRWKKPRRERHDLMTNRQFPCFAPISHPSAQNLPTF